MPVLIKHCLAKPELSALSKGKSLNLNKPKFAAKWPVSFLSDKNPVMTGYINRHNHTYTHVCMCVCVCV